jgi:hypothetical protein
MYVSDLRHFLDNPDDAPLTRQPAEWLSISPVSFRPPLLTPAASGG